MRQSDFFGTAPGSAPVDTFKALEKFQQQCEICVNVNRADSCDEFSVGMHRAREVYNITGTPPCEWQERGTVLHRWSGNHGVRVGKCLEHGQPRPELRRRSRENLRRDRQRTQQPGIGGRYEIQCHHTQPTLTSFTHRCEHEVKKGLPDERPFKQGVDAIRTSRTQF